MPTVGPSRDGPRISSMLDRHTPTPQAAGLRSRRASAISSCRYVRFRCSTGGWRCPQGRYQHDLKSTTRLPVSPKSERVPRLSRASSPVLLCRGQLSRGLPLRPAGDQKSPPVARASWLGQFGRALPYAPAAANYVVVSEWSASRRGRGARRSPSRLPCCQHMFARPKKRDQEEQRDG
jgi:hypothetical protein